MSHVTRIQIFKVNEARSGIKSERQWTMQGAEVALLDDSGAVDVVGELMLSKDTTDVVEIRQVAGQKAEIVVIEKRSPAPGLYDATFTLGVDRERRVIARIDSLKPAAPLPVRQPLQQSQVAKA